MTKNSWFIVSCDEYTIFNNEINKFISKIIKDKIIFDKYKQKKITVSDLIESFEEINNLNLLYFQKNFLRKKLEKMFLIYDYNFISFVADRVSVNTSLELDNEVTQIENIFLEYIYQ